MPPDAAKDAEIKIEIERLSVFAGDQQLLHEISLRIPARRVSVLMGRSGCGKSTLLRSINRLQEMVEGIRVAGRVLIDGVDVYAAGTDMVALRRKVGMVLQRSSVFECSIFDNVAFGPRLHDRPAPQELMVLVRDCLRRVGLLAEVEQRLDDSAGVLSGGQQQRLCVARALAVGPEVLLMDEPTSGLDAEAEASIEALIRELSAAYTVVLVTHDSRQAERVGDCTTVLEGGRIKQS